MNLQKLIKKHFPFKEFNEGQYEAIEQTIKAILAGKKHVIVSAPTGVGKSAIATTVHRVLKEYETSWRTTIITATKGLQDQYVSQDSGIFDLKGRKNYSCNKGAEYYNSSACRTTVGSGRCNKEVSCDYYKTRTEWSGIAPLRLTNVSFQIEAPPTLTMGPDAGVNLIVIDEAHDLPTHLVHHSTINLVTEEFIFCKKACDANFFAKLTEAMQVLSKVQQGTAFKPNNDQREVVKNFYEVCSFWMSKFMFSKSASEKGAEEELQQVADKVLLFCSQNSEWIMHENSPGKIVLKPVYASQVADNGIFHKAPQFIHMSATICGFDVYAKSLGLKEEDIEIVEIDNPIPIENRIVKLVCNVNVNKNVDIQQLVREIDKIIAKQGNANGVIHTVSFKLANEIKENSKYKSRMIVSNLRDEIEYTLKKPNSGSIILSPSIEKGYDFKGDTARWQIIAKVPYSFIGDPWVKLNMGRDQRWYSREAILRIVQASGRVCRGVTDHGITYIMDSNFKRLLIENEEIFPEWYLDSLELHE